MNIFSTYLILSVLLTSSVALANERLWRATIAKDWAAFQQIHDTDPSIDVHYAPKGGKSVFEYLTYFGRLDLLKGATKSVRTTRESGVAPSLEDRSQPVRSNFGLNEGLKPLLELILSYLKSESTAEKSRFFEGVPFVLHEVIVSKADELYFLEALKEIILDRPSDAHLILDLMENWIGYGPAIDLVELEIILKQIPHPAQSLKNAIRKAKSECLLCPDSIQKVDPMEDLLRFEDWESGEIATTLTKMCMPLFGLRAHEFAEEKKLGENLKEMNVRSARLSNFVAASVLGAATLSGNRAIAITSKWLEVSHRLRLLNNFHMMFAIHNGLSRDPVLRLKWLWNSLPRASLRYKMECDDLFRAEDRMSGLVKLTQSIAGRAQMIPCVFWFLQKAILLKEIPLLLTHGQFNPQRILSAYNVFETLVAAQRCPYAVFEENNRALSYFMGLEVEKDAVTDDEFYELSDSVRTKKSGSMKNTLSRKKGFSWEEAIAKEHSARRSVAAPTFLLESEEPNRVPRKHMSDPIPGFDP